MLVGASTEGNFTGLSLKVALSLVRIMVVQNACLFNILALAKSKSISVELVETWNYSSTFFSQAFLERTSDPPIKHVYDIFNEAQRVMTGLYRRLKMGSQGE